MSNPSTGTFVGFLSNEGQDKLVQLWFKSRPRHSKEGSEPSSGVLGQPLGPFYTRTVCVALKGTGVHFRGGVSKGNINMSLRLLVSEHWGRSLTV